MSGHIFLLQKGAGLVRMEETAYSSEGLLQKLLADYPDLLAGEQIDRAEPRRWLFICREIGVPDEEQGSDRWSLDHLFIDQDAVPTFVEVKRSSDTRIRREVVGQMLDYAANAVVYWSAETIRQQFLERCKDQKIDADLEFQTFLGGQRDPDEYWKQVKTNLQAGRVRLVFVADEIPLELRRVIEFLNGQMDPAEVLGVEIKQYVGENVQTLVPRVIGQTESAVIRKEAVSNSRSKIDEMHYWEIFERETSSSSLKDAANSVIRKSRELELEDNYNAGSKGVSYIPAIKHANSMCYPISMQSSGKIYIQMVWLKNWKPFDQVSKREELREQLLRIEGMKLGDAGMEGYPLVPLKSLENPESREQFLSTFAWIVSEIRGSSGKRESA